MAKDSLRFLGDSAGLVNCNCDILDKDYGRFQYVQYMFDKTNRMFHYEGLPDTIPEYMLEYMLQIFGSVAIIEHQGSLFAMRAEFGGPPDPYYRPTQAVVANPALGISGNYKIVNYLPPYERVQWDSMPECVRIMNDTQLMGMLPLYSRYATELTENDISIRSAQINLRQQTIIAADNGPEFESAQAYIHNLEAGKLAAIGKRPFLDGVMFADASVGSANVVIQLIELQQYLKASWYNEIGLNSNFNMKREYMSSEEIQSSADIMLPLIDNLFECRKQGLEYVNSTFGTNITVEKDSAWDRKQQFSDLSLGAIKSEIGDVSADEITGEENISSAAIRELVEPDEIKEEDSSQLDSEQGALEDEGKPEIIINAETVVVEVPDESEEGDTDVLSGEAQKEEDS